MDWSDYKQSIGTRVMVYDLDHSLVGEGKIIHEYDPNIELSMDTLVAIRVDEGRDSGKVFLGCDCWWIPLKELGSAAPLWETKRRAAIKRYK